MATLIVVSGPVLEARDAAKLFMVLPNHEGSDAAKRSIGRGVKPGLDLAPDLEVSERHAEVQMMNGGHRLVDIGSTNGTWLERDGDNAALVAHVANPLQHGDVIGLGNSVLIYVNETFTDLNEAMAAMRRDAKIRNILTVRGEARRAQERTT